MNNSRLALLLCLLLCSQASLAALRCGQKLVDIGYHQIDVLQRCGEPDLKLQRYGVAGQRLHHPGRTLDIDRYEEIVIDEWIYNFGSRHLMQSLLFENGILKEIRSFGYGY